MCKSIYRISRTFGELWQDPKCEKGIQEVVDEIGFCILTVKMKCKLL